jgi:hypothetical protein
MFMNGINQIKHQIFVNNLIKVIDDQVLIRYQSTK